MPYYIFVTGGVMSGVGKGIASASIGKILQSYGYNVSLIKIDPYINVDAGTMNPTEHGEIFVTEDGMETDQDLGHYERFLNQNIYRSNYMTTGSVYKSVIERERKMGYKGRCVEVIPDIPNEVISRIKKAVKKTKAEIIITEIGGTVGEYQNALFLEAVRLLKLKNPKRVLLILVSYLPLPPKIGEMKTKPTQHAVRTLNSVGLQPDIIIARSIHTLDKKRKEKISLFCNVDIKDVISAPDVSLIYDIPLNFEKDNLGKRILKKFNLPKRKKDLLEWEKAVKRAHQAKKTVPIGIVGKYFKTGDFTLSDSYISVIEALKHGSWANNCQPKFSWIDAEEIEKKGVKILKNLKGIVVPQGWGERGAQGKIKTIKYCRENKIPFLGLCFGMQMAVIEFARNVAGLKKANSEEIDPKAPHLVIHLMPDQEKYLKKHQYGGTIRLGAWPCSLKKGTKIYSLYKKPLIYERHRHRFEFNNKYRDLLEKKGLTISGTSPDNRLVEAIEITNHPFFIGTQFHPEYKSRFLQPHPIFVSFIKACLEQK